MARSPKALTAEQAWAACELVAESIPHIVWLSHPSGSTDYFNTFGTDYTGLPREANYGWRWLELVHPDDALLEAAQPAPEDRFGFVPAERRGRRVRADLDGAPSLRRELAGDLAAARSAVERLGLREVTVLGLIASGYTSAEVANLLGLSLRSIETSRYRLRQTLGVTSRAELVRVARAAGLAGPQV